MDYEFWIIVLVVVWAVFTSVRWTHDKETNLLILEISSKGIREVFMFLARWAIRLESSTRAFTAQWRRMKTGTRRSGNNE